MTERQHPADKHEFICRELEAGTRLDRYLAERIGQTRSQIKRLIDSGLIHVNGSAVKAGYSLKPFDRIEAVILSRNLLSWNLKTWSCRLSIKMRIWQSSTSRRAWLSIQVRAMYGALSSMPFYITALICQESEASSAPGLFTVWIKAPAGCW